MADCFESAALPTSVPVLEAADTAIGAVASTALTHEQELRFDDTACHPKFQSESTFGLTDLTESCSLPADSRNHCRQIPRR